MPAKTLWLMQIPEIAVLLETFDAPVVNCAIIERLFGLRAGGDRVVAPLRRLPGRSDTKLCPRGTPQTPILISGPCELRRMGIYIDDAPRRPSAHFATVASLPSSFRNSRTSSAISPSVRKVRTGPKKILSSADRHVGR